MLKVLVFIMLSFGKSVEMKLSTSTDVFREEFKVCGHCIHKQTAKVESVR